MKVFLIFFALVPFSFAGISQQKTDSSYIRSFAKENNIQFFPGYYQSRFNITGHSYQHTSYHFLGNTSAYGGFFFNYKWASILMSPNIPGTSIDRRDKNIKSIQFQTFHFWRSWGGEINYSQFRGLILKKAPADEIVEKFPDINYTGVNVNLYYFLQHTQYSYLSSDYCSERQIKSAGSPVVMLSPAFQQFKKSVVNNNPGYPDSLSNRFISGQPRWYSFTGRYGYSYNFVWKKGVWSVNPVFFLATGLSEALSGDRHPSLLSGYQFRLNAAYNGENYFLLFNGYYDYINNRFNRAFLESTNLNVALTFGFRFHSLHKKVLGIL